MFEAYPGIAPMSVLAVSPYAWGRFRPEPGRKSATEAYSGRSVMRVRAPSFSGEDLEKWLRVAGANGQMSQAREAPHSLAEVFDETTCLLEATGMHGRTSSRQ